MPLIDSHSDSSPFFLHSPSLMLINIILSSFLTFVSLNCENLFDCSHDSLKQDTEFLPESPRHWTPYRYWRKLNNISKAIISCGEYDGDCILPDFVALCEVENDSVMRDLTKRSLLRNARYEYIMTDSEDERGIDVALMYSPFSFDPISHRSLRPEIKNMAHPTRDVLYVSGRIITGDTLHVFVVHAPSRHGGERASRPHRMAVAEMVCAAVDSIRQLSHDSNIIVAGDFNAYTTDSSMTYLTRHGLTDVTSKTTGNGKAKGTYRYKGLWGSLDHVFVSGPLTDTSVSAHINDAPFLVEEDKIYGGVKPRRTYTGFRYSAEGVSDHLPLVVRFRVE